MICGPLPKTLNTSAPLLINKNTCLCFGFCNITAELSHKGLCSWPPENRSVDPKGGRGQHLLRNPGLEGFWWIFSEHDFNNGGILANLCPSRAALNLEFYFYADASKKPRLSYRFGWFPVTADVVLHVVQVCGVTHEWCWFCEKNANYC